MSRKVWAIQFVSADHKSVQQIIGRDEKMLSKLSCAEIWSVASESIEGRMHDRFIITEISGFSFSNSFQEKPDEKMLIARLGIDSLNYQKNIFLKSVFEQGKKIF